MVVVAVKGPCLRLAQRCDQMVERETSDCGVPSHVGPSAECAVLLTEWNIFRGRGADRGSDGNEVSFSPCAHRLLSRGNGWTPHASDFSTAVLTAARTRLVCMRPKRRRWKSSTEPNELELQRFLQLRAYVSAPAGAVACHDGMRARHGGGQGRSFAGGVFIHTHTHTSSSCTV